MCVCALLTVSENASLSNAMQGVQMAQQAVDVAQDKYDESIAKQAKMAAAMSAVDKKLKKLQETGQTLVSRYCPFSSLWPSSDR
jgi:hypothetical protein